MLLQSFIFTSLFTASIASLSSGTCVEYPKKSFCSNYVNYNVFLPNATTLEETESSLLPFVQLSKELGQVSPTCFDSFSRYICSKTYPKCEATQSNEINVYTACLSSCENTNTVCSALFRMTNQTQLLPNCSKETTLSGLLLQPDNHCNQIPTNMTQAQMTNGMLNLSAIPSNYIIKNCPSPFIKDPLAGTGTTVDNKYCRFGCCLPCPAQNYLYKKGWAKVGFTASNAVRFVSAILSLILVISYLVLPDKRRHPSLLILNLSISIFLFSMVSFFAIGDQEGLQCSPNGIAPGEMGNNALCAAQGAILVFSSFSTTLWCSALILNLHFHTVWNSNFFTNKYLMLNIICWGIPAVVTSVAIGLHSLKFEFASLCLVSMEYVFKLYFYPLAAIICPSFIIHIGTFFYIAKMAIQEKRESDMSQSLSTGKVASQGVNHRHIVAAVKIQWRALLLAVVAIATVLFYWLAYMTQVRRLTETENSATNVTSWLQCMLTPGNDQDVCYEIIKPILPNFSLMVTVDILAALIGFWLFLMFAKRSLWREWNDLIYDIRIICIYRKREKHAEQFFTL